MKEFTNDYGKLCFHKQSLRGAVLDYVIHFNHQVNDLDIVVGETFQLFEQLHQTLNVYKARLIAECEYIRLNDDHEIIDRVTHHFASYQAETVFDAEDFYTRHMQKIASRMDTFNQNGSNLLLHAIKHIHIAITCLNSSA